MWMLFLQMQYLDEEFIKRLQVKATRNVLKHQEIEVNKTIRPEQGSKSCQTGLNTVTCECKCVQTSPQEQIQSQTTTPPRIASPAKNMQFAERIESTGAITEIPQINNQLQQDIDDIEIILARITSSQRAICAAIDEIM